MVEIWLYTVKGPLDGLTRIGLHRVKELGPALRVVRQTTEQDIPLWSSPARPLCLPVQKKNTPAAGKADLLLTVAGRERNLCRCEGAVAVMVSATDATLYWLRDGRCYEVEDRVQLGEVHGKVEARCCREQILPPQIG